MRRRVNICEVLVVALALMWSSGCIRPPQTGDRPTASEPSGSDRTGFDPLDQADDAEVVPQKYPRPDAIHGAEAMASVKADDQEATSVKYVDLPELIDTLNHQAYRVQLFTSQLYGEARQAVRVAREIFDRPVQLDYEVPYYKVRVGSFSSLDRAEDYQQRVRTAGYPEAWVVMVNVGVQQAPSMYSDSTWPQTEDSLEYESGSDYDD